MKTSFVLVVLFGIFVAQEAAGLSMMPKKRVWPWRVLLRSRSQGEHGRRPSPPVQSYVPDGLSADEYSQLKQQEAARRAAMKYGAWGPRFQRSERPTGDWMVMPQLWTQGAVAGATTTRPNPTSSSSKRKRLTTWLQETCPAFVLALSTVNLVLFSSYVLWLGRMAAVLQWMTSSPRMVAIVASSHIAVSILLTRAFQRYLEYANRRLLWTQQRTFVVTTTTGLVVAWTVMTLVLRVGRGL
jgi:hypothetical protein